MPKRQAEPIRTVETPDVQGEDSWVKVRTIPYGDARKLMEAADGSTGDKVEVMEQMLRENVIEWNWVDYDDNALPQLKDDPKVLKVLTQGEILALVHALTGSSKKRKN